MRALLDTNIFVSYLLSSQKDGVVQAIFKAISDNKFVLLLPEALLDEMIQVVSQKPRLTARIGSDHLNRFTKLIQAVSETIPIITEEIPPISRDPKDDYLLAYAVVGEADYLVTGDKDLLVLEKIEGVAIVSPAAFAERLAKHT